jgi:hypothetical protein
MVALRESKLKDQHFIKLITYFWVPEATCLFFLFMEEKHMSEGEGSSHSSEVLTQLCISD